MKSARTDSVILCPKCGRGFLLGVGRRSRRVHCRRCAAVYPVEHGIVELESQASSRAGGVMQRLMETATLARIYESRGWRRSALAAVAFGLSFEEERELILSAAAVRRGQTVLDLACGTGIYTRPLAARARPGIVVGLDLSLPMLHLASQRRAQAKLHNMLLVHGTAYHLPFPAEHFDVVHCGSALHLFPQAAPVLREVHRVLKTGGCFACSAPRWEGASWVAQSSAAMFGIHFFSAGELEARCRRVGFGDFAVHHACRLWLVLSTRKRPLASEAFQPRSKHAN